jgi:hypothetical protein
LAALFRLDPRWHGFIAIDQIVPPIGVVVAAVLALVLEMLRDLRLLGKEPIRDTVGRYLGEYAFGVTVLAA